MLASHTSPRGVIVIAGLEMGIDADAECNLFDLNRSRVLAVAAHIVPSRSSNIEYETSIGEDQLKSASRNCSGVNP